MVYLRQEVLLRVLVKRRHSPPGPEPRIYSDVVFISLTQTAIVRDADILPQLWDLSSKKKISEWSL